MLEIHKNEFDGVQDKDTFVIIKMQSIHYYLNDPFSYFCEFKRFSR